MQHALKLSLLLLSISLACVPMLEAAEGTVANVFSPMKGKLQAGKDAVLFINGDSTSYSEYGPYYFFARALGEETGCTVVMHRWAEWEVSKPTGPKDYAPPAILYQGKTGAKLEVYLASLPGGVAGDMFAGARHQAALEAIPRPDCALLHQGHNMANFPVAFPGDTSTGRGLFLAAVAQTSTLWPGVPQGIVTQNPWRDGDQYARIYEVLRGLTAGAKDLTLIDSYQLFMAAGKRADLFRDNVHPADRKDQDAGGRMVAEALLAAWHAAQPGTAFSTPGWQEQPGASLISNGDFSEWKANTPAGWQAGGAATVEKAANATQDGKGSAVAVHPNGDKGAFLGKLLTEAECAAVRGRTITVAARVRAPAAQPRAYAALVCPVAGANKTFAFGDLNSGKDGWVWLVCSGIPVDEAARAGSIYLRLYPAFSLNAPVSNEPLLIERVLVLEGRLENGGAGPMQP
jgi:hypothetical protein